ncbi:uncharacterized protein J7T54_004193 [Emericellopsis cladophorae]|uniref:GS catalytic domain-containing protein n=1 Tax=Emericellopsis cladophorae TaxID=2686198 RepID=A0A9P9XUY3_9HYPO|nr:uncharacterized protein J7T54_004193 [Emericellopsis cladophorae]KAI6778286.1 hypothetical protein J7T54_004193 [Emericellopsis cladophorae]
MIPSHPTASSFLAVVMQRLKALCVFGLANFDSYCRVSGDCAGEWIGWGTGNEDLPVRGVAPNHWEFRSLDTTANVYLFAAALIYAGTAGIKDEAALVHTDCQVVPSALTSEETEKQLLPFGITDRMLRCSIGSTLTKHYMDVKEREVGYFVQMTDEERQLKFLDYS